jgi:hypothetical protein
MKAAMQFEQTMRDANQPDATDPVVSELLAYLQQHPQAADSLAGVARWWVGDDSRFPVESVQRALDSLVDDGALRRERLADGTEWYAAVVPLDPQHRIVH